MVLEALRPYLSQHLDQSLPETLFTQPWAPETPSRPHPTFQKMPLLCPPRVPTVRPPFTPSAPACGPSSCALSHRLSQHSHQRDPVGTHLGSHTNFHRPSRTHPSWVWTGPPPALAHGSHLASSAHGLCTASLLAVPLLLAVPTRPASPISQSKAAAGLRPHRAQSSLRPGC